MNSEYKSMSKKFATKKAEMRETLCKKHFLTLWHGI